MNNTSFFIKNGKLHQNSKEVALIIGDKDQIEFLKKYEKHKNGIFLDVEVTKTTIVSTDFKCICQEAYISIEVEGDDWADKDAILHIKKKCYKCGTRYEIVDNEDGDIIAKILND